MTVLAGSLVEGTRLSVLDDVLDLAAVQPSTSGELFVALDAVTGSSALRRALTDPGNRPERKAAVVRQLFGPRLGGQAVRVLESAVGLRWSSASAFLDALERQAIRAALATALNRGALDDVIDALFRFDRIMHAEPALQVALEDNRRPLEAREGLIDSLLAGRADEVTVALAKRALRQRSRSLFHAMESMLTVAAGLRHRSVARVVVARPLDEAQEARLRAALAKSLGRPVDLEVIVDPNVVGGARVVIGDRVIEGTIQQKLTDISRLFG